MTSRNPYWDDIIDYYESEGTSDYFLGCSKKRIHYRAFNYRKHKKCIVILPGRTEASLKYAEMVYDLRDAKHDIYILDHRGQGFSDRMLEDGEKGYVRQFRDYVSDLKKFTRLVLQPEQYENCFCIAHSMGTIVGLMFAQKYPRFFSGMVLSAPMLQLRLDDFPEKFVKTIFTFYKLMGKGKDYVINGGPAIHNLPWEKNRVTRSKKRWEYARWIEQEYPELEMGASTFNWVLEALYASEKCFRRRKRLNNMPILMFQAGNDLYVKKERQDQFCRDLEQCRSIFFEDAYHEIYQEVDAIRNKVMEEIRWFLKNHSKF